MRTRRFGRTGLEVPELVFGGGFVGGLLILKDDDTRRAALRRALDAGIDWIDTAAMYGQGRSETALGWLLPEVEAPVRLSTKVVVDPASSESMRSQVERGLNESLGRLKRDRVELFQLHNPVGAPTRVGGFAPVTVAQVLGSGGLADALEHVREQGLTDHVGMTALGDAPAIVEVLDSGRFDSAQVYYNLLNPSAARPMPGAWTGHDFSGVIDACRRQDTAVMGIRVFASGVLASSERHGREAVLTTDSALDIEQRRADAVFAVLDACAKRSNDSAPRPGSPPPWRGGDRGGGSKRSPRAKPSTCSGFLHGHGGDEHGTRAQTALRFALACESLACVVIGLAELEHLELAIEAQARGPLPGEAIAALEAVYERDFKARSAQAGP